MAEHNEAIRQRQRRSPKQDKLLRCWCGNLFVPRRIDKKCCTALCGQRARRAKLKAIQGLVVTPAPMLPPVDYDLILTEIMHTARRAQAKIDTEKELAGQAYIEKQERLAGILAGIRNPFAVP